MHLIPPRPRRPDLSAAVLQELELAPVSRPQLDEWLAWHKADAEWREVRHYRVSRASMIAAVIGAVAAIAAALEGL